VEDTKEIRRVPHFSRSLREVGSSAVGSEGFLNYWRSDVQLRRLTLSTFE